MARCVDKEWNYCSALVPSTTSMFVVAHYGHREGGVEALGHAMNATHGAQWMDWRLPGTAYELLKIVPSILVSRI